MNKVPTRKDVAKLAGVSPAVVSYVLNNSNYVSEEKREAVLKAVGALGYYPNVMARGLKTSKSSQIAFICDNIDNIWLADLETLLFEKGYYVSLCYSRQNDDFIKMLMRRQYEGIFMMTNIYSADQLNSIVKGGIPLVLYKTRTYSGLDSRIVAVAPDYFDGVKKSVDYLALKGHKRIALIPPIKYKTTGIEGNDFRVRAYVESLKNNNLPIEDGLVCINTQTIESILQDVYGVMTVSDPELKATAFVVGNDYLAAQVIQFVKKLGFEIPKDVAIIGADNTNIASITSPQLTSIDFCKKEFAEKAVNALIALINGEVPADEFINVRLVVRESA